jgi:hypothetical protein
MRGKVNNGGLALIALTREIMMTTNEPPGKPIESFAQALQLIDALPADPADALADVLRILANLQEHPPEIVLYLDILEEIRKPLGDSVKALGKGHYHNHALPHMAQEEKPFDQVIAALRQMNQGYCQCWQLLPEGGNERHRAQILHRNIHYTAAVIFEHYRAHQELPPGVWLELHGYYAMAESQGLAGRPVTDRLKDGQSVSCAASYIALLLIEISNPYSHDAAGQDLVYRLAQLGAPSVHIEPLDSMLAIPPFIFDLGEDAPLHPASGSEVGKMARYLNTKQLTQQMKQTLQRLQEGESVENLALGDLGKIEREYLISMLKTLHAQWTQTQITRRFRRHAGNGKARLYMGFEQIHMAISGAPFVPPQGQYSDRALASREDAVRFGLLDERQLADKSLRAGLQTGGTVARHDEWDILDQSASGFRLTRSLFGPRIAHGQLLAVRPPDSSHPLLAKVAWLMQDSGGSLHVGLTILPGMPEAVATAEAEETSLQFKRAFLLPGLEKINIPPSIIAIPAHSKIHSKLALASGDHIATIIVEEVLDKGPDFVQLRYSMKR